MSPLARKTIFYAFVFLFALIGAIVISYSLGWRINFYATSGGFTIQKIGAISISTTPKNVIIKIDDKEYFDQSGIIQNETLISNLLPKIYRVNIEKIGYYSYSKNIEILPATVSKLLKIRLVPEQIKKSDIVLLKGGSVIDLADNGNKFIINNQESSQYYLYDMNNSSSTFVINTAINNKSKSPAKIKGVFFIPFRSSSITIDDNRSLKIMNIENGTIETIIESPLVWTNDNSYIYFIKNKVTENSQASFIYSYNMMVKNTFQIAEIPKNYSTRPFIKMGSIGNKIAFLNDSGSIYLFDQNTSKIKEISNNSREFSLSPDGKKIASIDKNGKLTVYFMENSDINTIKKSGDVNEYEALENKAEIFGIQWYNDYEHLFIIFKNEEFKGLINIELMEIDNRSNLNMYPIAEKIQSYFYDSKSNIFYMVENNTLKKIEFNIQ